MTSCAFAGLVSADARIATAPRILIFVMRFLLRDAGPSAPARRRSVFFPGSDSSQREWREAATHELASTDNGGNSLARTPAAVGTHIRRAGLDAARGTPAHRTLDVIGAFDGIGI